jgi:hypothetical protein
MRTNGWALPLGVAMMLGGCGIGVPELQDFGDRDQQIVMVQSIVHNINCELRDSFADLYKKNGGSTFMDGWGVSILLDLDIQEKTGVSPTALWSPPPSKVLTFTLAGGISGSSQAERTDKLHSFFTVKQILNAHRCDEKARPGGFMLMESDLKLEEWLFDAVAVEVTHQADFNNKALPTDVLYHEIQFQVDTSADATPDFKLTRVNVNNSGTFFSTNRNRTHDLQITLGPISGGGKSGPAAGSAAANVALAGAIGRAVGDAVKSSISP